MWRHTRICVVPLCIVSYRIGSEIKRVRDTIHHDTYSSDCTKALNCMSYYYVHYYLLSFVVWVLHQVLVFILIQLTSAYVMLVSMTMFFCMNNWFACRLFFYPIYTICCSSFFFYFVLVLRMHNFISLGCVMMTLLCNRFQWKQIYLNWNNSNALGFLLIVSSSGCTLMTNSDEEVEAEVDEEGKKMRSHSFQFHFEFSS